MEKGACGRLFLALDAYRSAWGHRHCHGLILLLLLLERQILLLLLIDLLDLLHGRSRILLLPFHHRLAMGITCRVIAGHEQSAVMKSDLFYALSIF